MKPKNKAIRVLLFLAILSAPPGCALLRLPFQVLKIGFSAIQWAISNGSDLLPVAAMLAIAPDEKNQEGNDLLSPDAPQDLKRLLENPPHGTRAALFVPAHWLKDPFRREKLERELLAAAPDASRVRTILVRAGKGLQAHSIRAKIPTLAPKI